MDHAAKGKVALSSGDFKTAVQHYTNAIVSNPQAADYFVQRSTAFTRLSPPDHESALKDAEIAVVLANKRAKRELIASSQLRRAIALFGVGRWADSKQCLQWVKRLNDKEKSLAIWEMKADAKLKGLEEGDERTKVTIKETPEIDLPKAGESQKAEKSVEGKNNQHMKDKPATTTASTSTAPQGVQTPASKIRHEWYQSSDTITVTLFAKGVPKDKATVEINENSIEVSFPLPTGSDFNFSLDPLFSTISTAESSYKIMTTKMEFLLKKATPGHKWATLESLEGAKRAMSDSTPPSDGVNDAILSEKPAVSGPAYPTSSKSGPKNWDKLADEMTRKKKEGEGEAQDDANMPDDDEDGDPVNGFFKKLFKGADDDTKRAMMKSYQESNGTALSTNWAEVGKGPVETSPPDGMEAKKWGS